MSTARIMRFVTRGSVGVIVAGMLGGFALPATAATPNQLTNHSVTPVAHRGPLPYSPDTCKQGYVWREARPSDHVCVTPQNRQITWDENALAASRIQPGNNGYGPNACKSGFVWREAFDGDTVCADPVRRDQAKLDNSHAAERRATTPPPVKPVDRCKPWDGTASTGSTVAGEPQRYRNPGSPYLGARWDPCAHNVTLYYGTEQPTTHYNLTVNGVQSEQPGPNGARKLVLPDSQFGEGTATFDIQSCQRSSFGPFSSTSTCSARSPQVKLDVHMGIIEQR